MSGVELRAFVSGDLPLVEDNVASKRLLEACDFVRAGDPDADGFVTYRRGPRG
jgi:hypothetical protein